jgi:hypothetical protein
MSRSAILAMMAPVWLWGAGHAQQTLTVRAMALRPGDLPAVHLKGLKDHLPLEFSAVQPGEPVRALAANPLPLYHGKTDAKGNPSWVVAHQVTIPKGAKGILLLGWNDGAETRYSAIEDNFQGARYNDWLLINASSKPVAFSVGDDAKPVAVTAGTSITHHISARHGAGAPVTALTPIDGQTKVFYSTYWPVRQDRRTVVLFADDGQRILVRRIADLLTPPPP